MTDSFNYSKTKWKNKRRVWHTVIIYDKQIWSKTIGWEPLCSGRSKSATEAEISLLRAINGSEAVRDWEQCNLYKIWTLNLSQRCKVAYVYYCYTDHDVRTKIFIYCIYWDVRQTGNEIIFLLWNLWSKGYRKGWGGGGGGARTLGKGEKSWWIQAVNKVVILWWYCICASRHKRKK